MGMEGLLPTRAFAAGFAFLAMAGAGGAAGAEPVDCEKDARCETLRTFFASQGSPLGASAQVFVEKADQYGLDWRLLPAAQVPARQASARAVVSVPVSPVQHPH